MISKRTLALLGTVVNLGNFVGFIPFKFNPKTEQLELQREAIGMLKFGATLTCIVCYELFLIWRLAHLAINPSSDKNARNKALYMVFLYLCLNFNQYITLKHYDTYSMFVNEFLALCRKQKGLGIEEGVGKKYEKLTQGTTYLGVFALIMTTMLRAMRVFLKPASPELLTSLWEGPQNLSLFVKILCTVFQVVATGIHAYVNLFHGCFVVTYICSTLPIAGSLRLTPKVVWPRARDPHLASVIRRTQTQLSILQTEFNEVFNIWPLVLEICIGSQTIFRLFLALTTGSIRSLVTGAALLSLLILIFQTFAEIQDVSIETHRSWRVLCCPKWFRKYQRASRPICIAVGSFFYADKQLVLTIICTVIIYTTNLVLTFKGFNHE